MNHFPQRRSLLQSDTCALGQILGGFARAGRFLIYLFEEVVTGPSRLRFVRLPKLMPFAATPKELCVKFQIAFWDKAQMHDWLGPGIAHLINVRNLAIHNEVIGESNSCLGLTYQVISLAFCGGFMVSFTIAQTVDEDSPIFPIHMIVGMVLGEMLLLRLFWGLVGTRHAQFRSFLFPPAALVRYCKELFQAKGQRYVGHNPGSSYAIFSMLLLVGLQVTTGLLMSAGYDFVDEFHSVLAYVLLSVVVIHVLGVIWHTVRHDRATVFL